MATIAGIVKSMIETRRELRIAILKKAHQVSTNEAAIIEALKNNIPLVTGGDDEMDLMIEEFCVLKESMNAFASHI